MAWLKCQMGVTRIPVPTGVTYTNEYYKGAPISGLTWQNKSEVIDTTSAASITVSVVRYVEVYASGSSGSWSSYAENQSRFVFKVNGTTYVDETLRAESSNAGTKTNTATQSYTISNLPAGNCTFEYNFYYDYYQNGEQLDPHAKTTMSFTITSVTYRN